MVLNLQLTPLYGARTDGHALATMLSLDGLNILLDCGWGAAFDPTFLANLAAVAPSIHLVLLSHSDPAHLGALPYAFAKLGLDAIVCATLPVWRMGQMAMYDVFLSRDAHGPFSLFNLDDVDAAFDYASNSQDKSRFRLLKFQQHFPLDAIPHGEKVVVTPHRAAHMLGGAVWTIRKGTETIVYAAHVNHRKERHLNPTTLAAFSRPSHLILTAANADTRTESRGASDLVTAVTDVITRRGNVLIPTDVAGRTLEHLAALHDAWESNTALRAATLVLLHPLAARTIEFARSMIEWMSDEVVRRFDISRENLFALAHAHPVQSLDALDALNAPGPLVVLASTPELETGLARHIFARWAAEPRNAVIFPGQPEPDTLGARIHARAMQGERASSEPLVEKMELRKREPLRGAELEAWRDAERARKNREREAVEREEAAKRAEEEKAAESKRAAEEAAASAALAASRGEDISESKAQRFELDVLAFLRKSGATNPVREETFPFQPMKKTKWDYYGQVVDERRYIIGEDPGSGGYVVEETAEVPDVVEEQEEIPTKHVLETVEVSVRCQLLALDCRGLSDGDSLKRLLKDVEPRHVTIIGGTEAETEHLNEHLKKTMIVGGTRGRPGKDVKEVIFAPKEMEMVDVTSDMSVWQFSLDEKVVSDVAWDEIGLSRIGFVDAMVTSEMDEREVTVLGMRDVQMMIAADEVVGNDGHGTFFIGTVMMNKLKDKLDAAGVKAEFAGGALCVENGKTGVVVILRKVGTQHIVLEGAFSEEYVAVRDVLYNELVIPA